MRVKDIFGIFIILCSLAPLTLAQSRKPVRRAPAKPKAPVTTPAPAPEPTISPKELAEAATKSRENLVEASQTYRESLDRLLTLQQGDVKRATEVVAKRKSLLELGVIAKRELEEGETALQEAQKKAEETHQRINEVEQLVAEVMAAEQIANQPVETEPTINVQRPRVMLVRYIGRSYWALGDTLTKVDFFFRSRFGRPLPVSAYGQTETHNRLNFDHSNALDVAVHPDSAEGQALQAFLRAEGISFIAIRGAIAGSATGAHIHIGAPSKRLGI